LRRAFSADCPILPFLALRAGASQATPTQIAKRSQTDSPGLQAAFSPSFPTRGVDDPRSRSRTTSWSKGLPHKRDVLGLAQKLSARADAGRRLGRQSELELFEQKLVVGLRVSVAA